MKPDEKSHENRGRISQALPKSMCEDPETRERVQ
jgi:hypothetical protein